MADVKIKKSDGSWLSLRGPKGDQGDPGSNASIPAGVIVMWSGLLANIPSGWALCDGLNGTPDLRDKFVKGWANGVNPGGTGGNLTHAHANHSDLIHSGSAVADHAAHTHSVTSNVAVANHSVTQPTIAWPANVPTASGASVADHAAHTHSVTSNVAVADHASHTHQYTDVPNHTHPHNLQGSTTAATSGTNVMASTATGGSARAMAVATSNPTGGVAAGTTQGPSATLSHAVTNNAVTSGNPSATLSHSVTQPTIAWPAGVPTASGAAVDAHSVTNNAVTSGNPSATLSHAVTQPNNHVISAHDAVNHEPPYFKLAFIIKL